MTRGRRKKPAELAAKQGNPGRRSSRALAAALAGTVPTALPSDSAPPPPRGISEAAAEIWREYAPDLIDRGVYKASDRGALKRLCQYQADWDALNEALMDGRCKGGMKLTETHNRDYYGKVTKVRAEAAKRDDLERRIRDLETHFGMTPSSRASILSRLAEVRDPRAPLANRPAPGSSTDAPGQAPPASPVGLLMSRPAKMN